MPTETVRHALSKNGIRRVGSKSRGFKYRTASGRTIRGAKELARIDSLRIPPAWRDVHVASSVSARVQAVGVDGAGRLQYLYHPGYRRRQERSKYERLVKFADALPVMRRITGKHLAERGLTRNKVLAAMLRLVNAAYFRAGTEEYARKHRTYGIATLRRKHLSISGNTLTFTYAGKWGKTQRQAITDARLRKVVAACAALPGHEIFAYQGDDGATHDVKSRDLNAYVKEVMGDGFTVKDFRTWAGTLVAAWKLAVLGPAENESTAKKNVVAAIDEVAERLGNTRAIARSSYVNPRVLDHYFEGSVLAYYTDELVDSLLASQRGLSREEKSLLELLAKKLKREA